MTRKGSDWIAPDCAGMDFYAIDRSLQDLLRIYLSDDARAYFEPHFSDMGQLAGGRLDELARIADRHGPVLHARDRYGRDEDWIEYHPAYREMEQIAFGKFQFHAMSHRAGVLGYNKPLPPVAKYAFQYLFVQGEFGLMCPISVTDTSIHLVRKFGSNALQNYLLPKMLSADMGNFWKGTQFMTEKAGGSDVGAIETVARETDGVWRLYGDKWFCSHADADVALMLARTGGCAQRHERFGVVRAAAPHEGWQTQQLPDCSVKGQNGHEIHGVRRNKPGGSGGVPRRAGRSRPETDDGAGESFPTFARGARGLDDAPLRQRIPGRGARPFRLRA